MDRCSGSDRVASNLLGKSMKTQGLKAGSWRLSQCWCDLGARGQCAARKAKAGQNAARSQSRQPGDQVNGEVAPGSWACHKTVRTASQRALRPGHAHARARVRRRNARRLGACLCLSSPQLPSSARLTDGWVRVGGRRALCTRKPGKSDRENEKLGLCRTASECCGLRAGGAQGGGRGMDWSGQAFRANKVWARFLRHSL